LAVSNALEKEVENDINEKMASWNWEMNLEKSCLALNQKNLATAIKGKESWTVYSANMEEGVGGIL
jgi:hypothetical protein